MLRIAVTGPESSGKTTLCAALSAHYSVSCLPEYARLYLEKTKGFYEQKDLDCIAQGQFESVLSSQSKIVISDTDFSVLEVWSQYKYHQVSALIKEFVRKDLFDLHILCSPDIPWEEDPLRESPKSREELFELYKESLNKHNKNFIVVAGAHEERLKKSWQAIDALIKV
ncbi:MAG: ATP-binding protein [Flavobacteriales bacterium]|nr:ATP-binding protein [Flavobacteriales bacterium]